jgi:FkbM family methyltransferase
MSMIKIKHNRPLVQIGTNNGCDEFNGIVKYCEPSMVVLVEPNKLLNPQIYTNYKDITNVFVENVAIAESDKGMVKIVKPKNILTTKGKCYRGINYTDKHYSLLPMDDWGNDFDEIEIPSMSFMSLCTKYKLDYIHYLQIDTEGYDAEIIKSIDFHKVKIDIIKYEDWSFNQECFTRYGENKKKYGINGMLAVSMLLEAMGYILVRDSSDIIAIRYE